MSGAPSNPLSNGTGNEAPMPMFQMSNAVSSFIQQTHIDRSH